MTRFRLRPIAPALAGAALLALALPLHAAGTDPAPKAAQTTDVLPKDKEAPKSAQPSEDKDGAAARAKLNEEQAKFAANQLQRNSNSQSDYERKLQEVADAKAKIAADDAAAKAAYADQLKAYEAQKTKQEADYQAAMDKWKADVAACEAGEVSRCAVAPRP